MKKTILVMFLAIMVVAVLSAQTPGVDDFEIKQNPDNTITITRYKLENKKVVNKWDRYDITPFNQVMIPEILYGLPVTAIAAGAFRGKKINHVIIRESVTEIGNSAFEDCGLISVNILANLTRIGDSVFEKNELTSITIPNSVTHIGKGAFRKNKLTSVTIPNSVTVIGEGAFKNNRLTSVTIPNSVTVIGEGAFEENKLTSVTIPNSVTDIGEGAFRKNELTSVTLGSGLKYISSSAFADNRTIQSVTISAVINSVGSNVFGETAGWGSNPNRTITRITLPANLSDEDLKSYGFEDNFITFYGGQNRAAGTYTKNGPIWARSTAGGID
jgi:hypothetical protein